MAEGGKLVFAHGLEVDNKRENRYSLHRIYSIEEWRLGVDKFDAMQMFVRLVEKGSFSAVAKERGIGQPAVSKQISALEDELGTELIHRTSRSIALTDRKSVV